MSPAAPLGPFPAAHQCVSTSHGGPTIKHWPTQPCVTCEIWWVPCTRPTQDSNKRKTKKGKQALENYPSNPLSRGLKNTPLNFPNWKCYTKTSRQPAARTLYIPPKQVSLRTYWNRLSRKLEFGNEALWCSAQQHASTWSYLEIHIRKGLQSPRTVLYNAVY